MTTRVNHELQQPRARAIMADSAATIELNLGQLWNELTNGIGRVADSFFHEERCYLMVTAESRASSDVLQGRRLEILEAILYGKCQKSIAIDLDLAPSTVAIHAKLALQYLGLDCTPSQVPPQLMSAAHAARDHSAFATAKMSSLTHGNTQYRIIGMSRPDQALVEILSPAELTVVRMLIEGERYSEIARRRGTSLRTIANQLATAFRRIGVSGRGELLHHLITEQRFAPRPTTMRPRARNARQATAPESPESERRPTASTSDSRQSSPNAQ